MKQNLVLDSEEVVRIFRSHCELLGKKDIDRLVNQCVDYAIDSLETIANGPQVNDLAKLHFRSANLGLLDHSGLVNEGKVTEYGLTVVNEFNVLYLKLFGLLKSFSDKLIYDEKLEMKVFPYFFHRLKRDSIILIHF